MKSFSATMAMAALLQGAASQNFTFYTDPLVSGPPLELVHAYLDQWPTGVFRYTLSYQ